MMVRKLMAFAAVVGSPAGLAVATILFPKVGILILGLIQVGIILGFPALGTIFGLLVAGGGFLFFTNNNPTLGITLVM